MSSVCPQPCAKGEPGRFCFLKCARKVVNVWNNATATLNMNHDELLNMTKGVALENALLRVEPIGIFQGNNMAVEYLLIFSSPTGGPITILEPQRFVVRSLSAQRPVIAATIDYEFKNVLNGRLANMTIQQWYRLDTTTNKVQYHDSVIQRYTQFIYDMQLVQLLTSNPTLASATLKAPVCQVAMKYCNTPELRQYNSTADCMKFLDSIPLVDTSAVASNSVTCRYVHTGMVYSAPAIHCPHIGPSGGGACVDRSYLSYYTENPFPADAFTPWQQG